MLPPLLGARDAVILTVPPPPPPAPLGPGGGAQLAGGSGEREPPAPRGAPVEDFAAVRRAATLRARARCS
jgi:hypothetical protein